MIKKILSCLSAFLMLAACQQEEVIQKPEGLVPESKMISFLIDMHIAEAKMGYLQVKDRDSLEIIFRNYEKALFEKHQVDDSAYYHSYEYYLADMEKMHEIYSAVVDSLSVLNSIEKNKDLGISEE
ncbi:hypothetical protein OKW21_006330 [Catalinimonas alkaloidigena]|uniref:DUF4296 domain-containing protein n=1 Tax=Catalinimonas alkaloidigena TaxID=1075417 RepID=UPI002405DEAE|nr:DUF4296 domain-containing protein [Catalinimonas alkaloidigena]MDF9801067.1 hypothetical protein [Catalinimonas alkaloidigena]